MKMTILRDTLKQVLIDQGLYQSTFASVRGIDPSTISNFMKTAHLTPEMETAIFSCWDNVIIENILVSAYVEDKLWIWRLNNKIKTLTIELK